jgi:hypothetical protein
MLVGGVIVGDEVDIEALRRLPLDLLQEAQPFDMRVARFGAGDQLSFKIIERREYPPHSQRVNIPK